MRVPRFALGMTLAVLPLPVVAAMTTWNFEGEQKISGWSHGNLTKVELVTEGLHIETQTAGQLVRMTDIGHSVSTIAISYNAINPSKGVFLWRPKGNTDSQVYHIAIDFAAGPQKLVLDMKSVPQWDPGSDKMGFVFEPGTNIVLQKIEFGSPGMFDSVFYGVQSFWVFDDLRPYSINFLWGPMLVGSSGSLQALFERIPPMGKSANGFFYGLSGLALVILFLTAKVRGKYSPCYKKAAIATVIVIAGLWLLYDLRMGMELVSYAQNDLTTWWSPPLEQKQLRDRGGFNAFLQAIAPSVEGKEKVVFAASRGWPYWGSMKYNVYPTLLIAPDKPEAKEIGTWVVYDRPDIVLDADGRLTIAGQPVSPPGKIILPLAPGAFVFEATL